MVKSKLPSGIVSILAGYLSIEDYCSTVVSAVLSGSEHHKFTPSAGQLLFLFVVSAEKGISQFSGL